MFSQLYCNDNHFTSVLDMKKYPFTVILSQTLTHLTLFGSTKSKTTDM